MIEALRIDARYCGPPGTGNGGYVAGRLARHISGPAEVTLRAPTPLETDLQIVEGEDGERMLREGERELASARPATLQLDVPAPPASTAARDVEAQCRAFQTHPFPRCFVCGPERTAGDGLRILPGPVGAGRVAALWKPDESHADARGRVDPVFVWAALDCTSAFPLLEDPAARALEPMVLGRLAVAIGSSLQAGEEAIVTAWTLGLAGRHGTSGCAIFGNDGRRVGTGRATWISIAAR